MTGSAFGLPPIPALIIGRPPLQPEHRAITPEGHVLCSRPNGPHDGEHACHCVLQHHEPPGSTRPAYAPSAAGTVTGLTLPRFLVPVESAAKVTDTTDQAAPKPTFACILT